MGGIVYIRVPGMQDPKYILKSTIDGRFLFYLTSRDGQIILTSATYLSKSKAVNALFAVQINCTRDELFVRHELSNDQFGFELKAINGKILAGREMYFSSEARENGIELIKQSGYTSQVDDQTVDEAILVF